MKKNHLTYLLFVILLLGSCKKLETHSGDPMELTGSNKSKGGSKIFGIPTYPLNWENIDYMPTPSGAPSILVPWASGSSRQFTVEIANDYKSVDGWVLVYNTFNTSTQQDKLYFILYNKYRGLLRMYYYLPNTTNLIQSSNIVHKLGTEGSYSSSSPIMNFAGSEVVDFSNNTNFASTLEQWQIAPATWYAFEYELAYDPNLSTQNFGTLNFIWPITANQITQVQINGNIDGTLKGNISLPGTDLTVNPTISVITGGQINIKGDSDVEKGKTSFGTQLYNTLKGLVTKNLTNIAGGFIEKIFSGIFGGKTNSNSDNVNLKINATISFNGSLSSNFLLNSNALSVPGYDQTNTSGFTPDYNNVLGVFYVANKPTITETVHSIPQTDPYGNSIPPKTQVVYAVKLPTVNLIFNPLVQGIANIENITYQVITQNTGILGVGSVENIGNNNYVVGTMVGIEDNTVDVVGVRVAFDVVPISGSTKSVITKTFAVNKETLYVTNPQGQYEW